MRTLHQIIHFRQLTFFFSRRSIVEDVLLISGHTFLVTHGECAEANRELPAVHSWAGNLMLRRSVCLLTSAAYPPLQYSVQRVLKVRESITDSYSSSILQYLFGHRKPRPGSLHSSLCWTVHCASGSLCLPGFQHNWTHQSKVTDNMSIHSLLAFMLL